MLLCAKSLSSVWFFVNPWTVASRAPLSLGFSRQEYWSGLPCPPLRDLPNPGIKLVSLMSPPLTARFFTTSATWKPREVPKTLEMLFFLNSGLNTHPPLHQPASLGQPGHCSPQAVAATPVAWLLLDLAGAPLSSGFTLVLSVWKVGLHLCGTPTPLPQRCLSRPQSSHLSHSESPSSASLFLSPFGFLNTA